MGDIADMYKDLEFDYGIDDDDRDEEYASRGIWPSKSGEIHVSKMSDEHLANALVYIQKSTLNSPLQFMLEGEIARRSHLATKPTYQVSRGIKPFISTWAIRQKSTGKFLPARKNGRGYSFDEPSFEFPRLFKSELSARRALSAWLRGIWDDAICDHDEWSHTDYKVGAQPRKVEGRDASDMEIVKFCLVERGV